MKEAANLGRPRLIDASSLTVLNNELPINVYRNNAKNREAPYAPISGFVEYELIASRI
jgi:hypothetical protein